MSEAVLSLFPGIDLFGRAFEEEGYCVLRGPDLIYGGDVRRFRMVPGVVDGVIGGPPCVDYSSLRREAPTGEGDELVREFLRVVREAAPCWWLMENVPRVPSVVLDGWDVQRIDVRGGEVGLSVRRLRHFQFGRRIGTPPLAVPRHLVSRETEPAPVASEGTSVTRRRGWDEFCGLMGLPPLELPGMTRSARYRAVGNGVPIPMGRLLASAIREWAIVTAPGPVTLCDLPGSADGHTARDVTARTQRDGAPSRDAGGVTLFGDRDFSSSVCVCGCGRPVTGRRVAASAACRKRMERRRRGQFRVVGLNE